MKCCERYKYLLVTIIIAVLTSCNHRDATPRIRFSRDTFYFGTIHKGDSVNAVFHFSNTGSAPLVIKKLGPGCGCTNAYVNKDQLAPADTGVLYSTYHSRDDSGMVLKTIVVESNTSPVLHTLFIKGNVQ